MLFTSHDIDVIERALRIAISQEKERIASEELREVLHKLSDNTTRAWQWDEPQFPADRWLQQLGDD